VASRSGPIFAGNGFFEATISGRGGHAALPQHSIDPILAVSNVIVSLQQIISREIDPLDSQVNVLFYLLLSFPTGHYNFVCTVFESVISKEISLTILDTFNVILLNLRPHACYQLIIV
jgi:hypothetical protein